MRSVQLGVSWVDGEAFSKWWEPLPGATEFHLLSCYVSEEGWAPLREILDSQPCLRATLVFSLSGIGLGLDQHFALKLLEFLSAPIRKGRVRGYLIADKGRLFHPKAHASWARGQTRVVVGSANLTGGGRSANHEMVSVIDDDEQVYNQFIAAVQQLSTKTRAIEVNESSQQDLLRWLEKRSVRSATRRADSAEFSPIEPSRETEPPLPPKVEHPLIDSPKMAGGALLAIERLLRLGGRLHDLRAQEDLTVSVSLTDFKKAGILAGIGQQRFGPGLTIQDHSALAVALIPDTIRQKLKELNQCLGQLTGRFALDAAGLPWLPAAWHQAFFGHWKEVILNRGLDASQVKDEVSAHLGQLKSQLEGTIHPLLDSAPDRVRSQPLDKWDRQAAARLLDYPSEADLEQDAASCHQRALNSILKRVRHIVGSRLQEEFVLEQFANIHQLPRFRTCAFDHLDTLDGLQLLADWTLAGIAPLVRLDPGVVRAPTNGVAQALHKRLDVSEDKPIEIYRAALSWRRQVSAPQGDSAELLEEAWAQFCNWFNLRPADMDCWLGSPPCWQGGRSEDIRHAEPDSQVAIVYD